MKALIMEKDRTLNYCDIKDPVPGEKEVLIKVKACGICGTDMHVYRGMDCTWALPGVIGHEFSGTVLKTGKGCRHWREGDQVTVQPLLSCGKCERCREGRTNLCQNVKLTGGERPGAFAELAVVPEENVIRLPKKMSLKYGALAEPAATAVHAAKRLKRSRYDSAVIKGAGSIGLLLLMVMRDRAGSIIVSDIDEKRLDTARKLGAACVINPLKEDMRERVRTWTGERMADVVMDAAGEKGGRSEALSLLHPGGELLLAALGNTVTELDFAQVITQEISIYGTQCHTKEDFQTAIRLMEEGAITYEDIVTEMSLRDGAHAFENPGMGIKIHLFP